MFKPKTITNVLKSKIIDPWREWTGFSPLALLLLIGLGFSGLLLQCQPAVTEAAAGPSLPPENLATFIPVDQTLIPIRVSNYESLDQIIGQFGVVDLYSTAEPGGAPSRLLVQAVKILATGENQGYFNVLVNEKQALAITSHSGEFTIGIRNPKKIGTKIVKRTQKKLKRIQYYEED